ncbi:MAG TPA: hypothetical protein VMP89_18690, partial [Solirubrobacteraceae bacterium]|nr:hypothetical protein [Solirubrobacteraceae bacterium]
MRASAHRTARLTSLLVSLVLLSGVGVASARSNSRLRAVSYHGYTVAVPRSWPVYDLSTDPRACVRFDRHALYLGAPSSAQRCPAHVAGRAEAILLEPVGASAARHSAASESPRMQGNATSFVATPGVRVTATWSHERAVIVRALHRKRLPPSTAAVSHPAFAARISSAQGHTASAVYTGLGFDAC